MGQLAVAVVLDTQTPVYPAQAPAVPWATQSLSGRSLNRSRVDYGDFILLPVPLFQLRGLGTWTTFNINPFFLSQKMLNG